MRRFYTLFISFVFILLTGFSGNHASENIIRLEWNPRLDISSAGQALKCLHFTGAIYDGGAPFIPVFTFQTEIGENENPVFEIENPVFSIYSGEVSDDEKAALKPELEPVTLRKKSGKTVFAELRFAPLIYKNGQVFVLESFGLKKTGRPEIRSAAMANSWKTSSALASGKWVKIKTAEKGIYKITYDKLKEWGFDTPANVNVFGAGGYVLDESLDAAPVDDISANKIWHGKDNTGKDCIFFFATGSIRWTWNSADGKFEHKQNIYSSDAFYFLTQDAGNANLVEKTAEITTTATHTITAFDDYVLHENEDTSLINSGQQWYGEKFSTNASRQIAIQCPDMVAGGSASATLNAAGRSSSVSWLDVKINDTKVESISFSRINDLDDKTIKHASEKKTTYSAQPVNSRIVFDLTYSASNSTSNAWLDYIALNWRRNLAFAGDVLYFRDTGSVSENNVCRFEVSGATSAARIFDITEPASVFEIPASMQNSKLAFVRQAETLREYMIFNPSAVFPEPEFVADVENQNLHAMEIPDFLIISHPDFLSASNSIAAFHRENDNMTVSVVPIVQIYNEFGSGMPDATAIRNFCKMLYDKGDKLKYVMLTGNGCFDNRNILGSNRNFIPTFQSAESLTPVDSFVSDDYFVILDSGESVYNGTVDLGIGRLPVSSAYEADIVVRKILNYHESQTLGEWRNSICFLADDGDSGRHANDTEELANSVDNAHGEYHATKIYFDAYKAENTSSGKKYPGVTEAINNRIKDGTLIFNYIGHANNRYLADESVVDISTINSWTNYDRLPIFVTATCEFSRFDDLETSAGEQILLSPHGGGIGLFSTTRVVYAVSNQRLSLNFYKYVFSKDENGQNLRMGDVMRLAKIDTPTGINKRSFTLLADPALQLAYPRHNVVTKTINGIDASVTDESFPAMTKVTITGEIVNEGGAKVSDFNGNITPVVYNRPETMKTLGNSGQTQVEYVVQNNIVYKGSASVRNGEFSFSFVIPKDVPYDVGEGKIVYYAENGQTDANGVLRNFKIGGSSDKPITDNTGPQVDLYIDDTSFEPGGKTNKNPLLLAHIFDESGINTVGTGIGHDITAVLDNDYSTIYVLNDYYTASKDDFTRGVIEFPFSNLEEGEHTVTLKVWDVANNSTEAEINFVVTGDFYIQSVSNYPNPVYDQTYFVIKHNQGDTSLSLLIEIFDSNGKKVDSMQQTVSSSGGQTTPVYWNLDSRRLVVRSGIYPYRAVIRSSSGKLASKSGKMVIGR